MQKRERIAALAGAILLTIGLPIAIDQGYFRYNPYLLPVLALIAVLLYLGFFITSNTCKKKMRGFYSKNHKLSLIGFIVAGTILASLLGIGEWKAIEKSMEHVSKLQAEDRTKPQVEQPKQPPPKEEARQAEQPEKVVPPKKPEKTVRRDKAMKQETRKEETQEKSEPTITVALRFVYPKSPALVIINQSDVVVRDIKWGVVLWNMDLPERNDPLPIPVQTFDWLKPHDEGGPQDLFGTPLVAPLLKPGDRLFGSATVDCPACISGRTYIVYIVWEQAGWFAEVENGKSGHFIIPSDALREGRENYFKHLEASILDILRVPIRER